jgi:hypothetical protein
MKSLKKKAEELGLPVLPDKCTMGDKYKVACEKVRTPEQAKVWLEILIKHNMSHSDPPHSRETAEDIERQNIGYFAGYYDHDIQKRVYSLFNTEHPIFGKTSPTPEQALKAGMELGMRMKPLNMSGDNPVDIREITDQVKEKIGVRDTAHEKMRKQLKKNKRHGTVR